MLYMVDLNNFKPHLNPAIGKLIRAAQARLRSHFRIVRYVTTMFIMAD